VPFFTGCPNAASPTLLCHFSLRAEMSTVCTTNTIEIKREHRAVASRVAQAMARLPARGNPMVGSIRGWSDAGSPSPYRLIPAVNLLMQWESRRESCLKVDLFPCDGVVEFQILGVQEISSIAGEAGEILKRLAV
jgi:hypothetical protein